VITHGDQSIDVSSAAQGDLSSSPSGIYPHQNIPYPSTKYCFDDNFFGGIDAKDLLVKMLKSPNCIDGCKLVSMRQKRIQSHFRKGAWTFVCSHGIVMNDMDESHFYPDSVGKSNVPIQGLKCTKSRGRAVKGEMMFLVMNSYVPMNSYIYEFISFKKNCYPSGTLTQYFQNLVGNRRYGFERHSKKVG
jgi:hypothetical protein